MSIYHIFKLCTFFRFFVIILNKLILGGEFLTFCFFSAQYLPTVGGVERYTHSLANKLVAAGHSVIVVTSKKNGLSGYEEQDGVKVYRVPTVPFASGRLPIALPFLKWSKIKKALKQEKIDFIVAQTRLYTLSLFGIKFAHKIKVPAIIIDHSTAHILPSGIIGFLCSIYEHIIVCFLKLYKPEFYGVSNACTKWLTHFGIKTQKVLYNAVEPQILQTLSQNAMQGFATSGEFLISLIESSATKNDDTLEFLKSTNANNIKAIVYSGRFVAEKGVTELICAFESIKEKHPEAVLLLGGNGPQFEEIKSNLKSRVFLLGMLPYDKNLALLKCADIFCLPSLAEGFPTTVLEAAALKTVVVATNVGGNAELIRDNDHGIIIENNSPQNIAAALDSALSDDNWRNKATNNTFNTLCNNFTWQKVSEKLIDIANKAQN